MSKTNRAYADRQVIEKRRADRCNSENREKERNCRKKAAAAEYDRWKRRGNTRVRLERIG